MRKLGVLPQLHELISELRPDIVIAPSGGTDPLVLDAFRSARELGITTLLIPFNWDNLSSKSAYPILPDYLGVVGPQSVEHAQRIHRIPKERVSILGAPYIDAYFHREPELDARRRSRSATSCSPAVTCRSTSGPRSSCSIGRSRSRGSTSRSSTGRIRSGAGGEVPDRVDESRLSHVVIDPQVRDQYLRSFDAGCGRAGSGADARARLLPRAARARRVRHLPAVDDGARVGDLRATGGRDRLPRRHPQGLAGRDRQLRPLPGHGPDRGPPHVPRDGRPRAPLPPPRRRPRAARGRCRCARRSIRGSTTTSALTASAWPSSSPAIGAQRGHCRQGRRRCRRRPRAQLEDRLLHAPPRLRPQLRVAARRPRRARPRGRRRVRRRGQRRGSEARRRRRIRSPSVPGRRVPIRRRARAASPRVLGRRLRMARDYLRYLGPEYANAKALRARAREARAALDPRAGAPARRAVAIGLARRSTGRSAALERRLPRPKESTGSCATRPRTRCSSRRSSNSARRRRRSSARRAALRDPGRACASRAGTTSRTRA